MAARHLITGEKGERRAERYLRDLGYLILARNWREKQLELDLVAKDGDTIVFVEVKTRHVTSLGRAGESVPPAKRAKLCRAASAYLSRTDQWEHPCRFDVVAVEVDQTGQAAIRLTKDAFGFDQPGAPGWQPF